MSFMPISCLIPECPGGGFSFFGCCSSVVVLLLSQLRFNASIATSVTYQQNRNGKKPSLYAEYCLKSQ